MKRTILGTTMLLMMTAAVSAFNTGNTKEACCKDNKCSKENCDMKECKKDDKKDCCVQMKDCCKEQKDCCKAGAGCEMHAEKK